MEVLVTATVFVALALLVGGLTESSGKMWARAQAQNAAQEVIATAVGRLEPTVLEGRRIDTALSDDTSLTVVLTRVDGAGKVVLPPEDGDRVTFYLSNKGGGREDHGTVLWRSINGRPDRRWAMRRGTPVTDFGTRGLRFSYPSPHTVTLTVTTEQWAGPRTLERDASSTLFLRNHQ
jgi:hypothetical protein